MALPAGCVRSPAKPRMRDLCQCGVGAENKIFYRCLKAGFRSQQRLTQIQSREVPFKVQMMCMQMYFLGINLYIFVGKKVNDSKCE